jgi:hypothetical protein
MMLENKPVTHRVTSKATVDLVVKDGAAPYLVGEASTMGLAVGEWPTLVTVFDDDENGFTFQLEEALDDGTRIYRTTGGTELRVLND